MEMTPKQLRELKKSLDLPLEEHEIIQEKIDLSKECADVVKSTIKKQDQQYRDFVTQQVKK